MIGYIYHVVNKTTNEIVKVGSTIRSLRVRWSEYDKQKYSNHVLKLAKIIDDSSDDFLWHLVAAEHMEILKVGTFRKGPLSNQFSPLDQKYFGLDQQFASAGGLITGLKNVESGHLKAVSSRGGLACAALMEKEKKGIFSPNYDRVAAGRKFGKISGKVGGPKGMHVRWHVNRGIQSSNCKHCIEAINVS